MNINDMIEQLDQDDRIELVRNEKQPFPAYEMELFWMEEIYEDNGPSGFTTIVFEGTAINPVDFTHANGDLDEQAMIAAIIAKVNEILEGNIFLELVINI